MVHINKLIVREYNGNYTLSFRTDESTVKEIQTLVMLPRQQYLLLNASKLKIEDEKMKEVHSYKMCPVYSGKVIPNSADETCQK